MGEEAQLLLLTPPPSAAVPHGVSKWNQIREAASWWLGACRLGTLWDAAQVTRAL